MFFFTGVVRLCGGISLTLPTGICSKSTSALKLPQKSTTHDPLWKLCMIPKFTFLSRNLTPPSIRKFRICRAAFCFACAWANGPPPQVTRELHSLYLSNLDTVSLEGSRHSAKLERYVKLQDCHVLLLGSYNSFKVRITPNMIRILTVFP